MARPRRKKLRPQQLKAIRLVVDEGCCWAEVARRLDMNLSTVHAWRTQPLFCEGLEAAHAEYEETVWTILRAAAKDSAMTLLSVACDTEEKGSVRMMAAAQILDRTGFKELAKHVSPTNPFADRGDLVGAIAALPVDVLADALAAAKARPHA